MDALELSLRCSALLIRSVSNSLTTTEIADINNPVSIDMKWSDADYEKHFNEHGKFNLKRKLLYFIDNILNINTINF